MPRDRSSRHFVFVRVLLWVLAWKHVMAGDGAVDIDLYATVDEFEPEVAGQVIFREQKGRVVYVV